MNNKYYSLLVLINGLWSIEFGDYNKDVVMDEKDEYQGFKCKIITTKSDQKSIDEKVNELNIKLKG